MTNKRYFKIEYDEEWYLFDSTTISEQLVKEQAEYGYGVFANSLSPSEICDVLNTLHQENIDLDEENAKLLSERIKDLEQFEECVNKAKQLREENEQLRTQLLICQQYNDDGRFQVWEVPPIPKGTRITFSTTERSGKNE